MTTKILSTIYKSIFIILFLCLYNIYANAASYTTVTITLTDSSSQVWSNATWRTDFVPPFGSGFTPTNQGTPISNPQTGSADGSGNFTVVLDDNKVVSPAGSQWRFTICPNASVSVCNTINLIVTGSTQNLSSAITPLLTIPSITALPSIQRTYLTSQAIGGFGSIFANVTDTNLYLCQSTFCNGTGWTALGSGGGGGGINCNPTCTNNFIPLFTSTTTIGNSPISYDGANTVINTTSIFSPVAVSRVQKLNITMVGSNQVNIQPTANVILEILGAAGVTSSSAPQSLFLQGSTGVLGFTKGADIAGSAGNGFSGGGSAAGGNVSWTAGLGLNGGVGGSIILRPQTGTPNGVVQISTSGSSVPGSIVYYNGSVSTPFTLTTIFNGTSGNVNWQWPINNGTNLFILKTDGTGITSWTDTSPKATQLAATPTQCSGATPFATGIAANGNANCAGGNILASLEFNSGALAPNGGGEWSVTNTASWGVTLGSSTYKMACSLSCPGLTTSGGSCNALAGGYQADIFINSKSTTGFNYTINDDHSGANGATYIVDCQAF